MKKLFSLFICALFVFTACKNQEPKDLVVSSIQIGGVKVTDNKVTVPESLTKVEIKNVSVTFVGENLPIVKMEPSELNLEYKGHEYNLKLSTDKTKDWKAWNSATIKVVRGGHLMILDLLSLLLMVLKARLIMLKKQFWLNCLKDTPLQGLLL